MKLVVKGLVCDISYIVLEKPNADAESYQAYSSKRSYLEHMYSFLELEAQEEHYDIIKCFKAKSEDTIFTKDVYHIKPSLHDCIRYKEEDLTIVHVVLDDTGHVVTCVVDKVIKETLVGDSLEVAKAKAERWVDSVIKNKPKKKSKNVKSKILNMFSEHNSEGDDDGTV